MNMEEINTKDIFDRLNLQQIRSFVFEETPVDEIDTFSYEQRLNASSVSLLKRIKMLYKDNPNELENAELEIITLMSEYKNVYAEIGMKIGAKLMVQLLYQD